MNNMFTISEAARAASTSRLRIYNAINRGDLKLVKGSTVPLLNEAQVMEWAALPKRKGGRPRKEKMPA